MWEGKYARETHGSEGLFGKVCDLGQVDAPAIDENHLQGLRGVLLFPVWETETRLPMRIDVTFTTGNVCPAFRWKSRGHRANGFQFKTILTPKGPTSGWCAPISLNYIYISNFYLNSSWLTYNVGFRSRIPLTVYYI